MEKRLPILCLNGFLGAGKTTTLKHVLETVEKERIGVVCNDVAAVNIDAECIQTTILSESGLSNSVQSVQLQNGCLCCTASEDLLTSIKSLLAANEGEPFDRIIIESTGVAEPSKLLVVLKEAEKDPELVGHGDFLSGMVTIVDSPCFLEEFQSRDVIGNRSDLSGEPAEPRNKAMVVDLLVDQVETADLVVLNKIDCMNEPNTTELLAEIIRRLNPSCSITHTTYGRFGLLSRFEKSHETGCRQTAELSIQHAHAMQLSHEAHHHEHEHDHDCVHCCSEEGGKSKYSITSFVYNRDKPFAGQRLAKQVLSRMAEVQRSLEFPEALSHGMGSLDSSVGSQNPFSAVIRSKGFTWLDKKPDTPFFWSSAGKSFSVSPQPSWGERPPGQTLVFIGVDMDEDAIVTLLDSALSD